MSTKLFYGENDNMYVDSDVFTEKDAYAKERGKILYKSNNNKIKYYPTKMTPGCNIYNAVTGKIYLDYFVGKDPFFKVLVLSEHLYYESPEEYEIHFKTNIHPSVRLKWYEKNSAFLFTNNS